jgi:DNA mismatch endonuclease (patch repair protein)
MRAVKRKHTAPELIVRKALFGLGYRYRLHVAGLPGSPDLVFPKRRKVVFVHGCFWHAHGCRPSLTPQSKTGFWGPKLNRNQERDSKSAENLAALGWDVMIVWECDTRPKKWESMAAQLPTFLGPPRALLRADSDA